MKQSKAVRALLVGLCAVPLFALLLWLAEACGYELTAWMIPDFAHDYASVFPGAVLASLAVMELAQGSRWKGALCGAALAPLNAPFSVLCNLAWWQLRANLGLTEPWRYGWEGLFSEWQRQAVDILWLGLPLAIPCGLLLGAASVRPRPAASHGPE